MDVANAVTQAACDTPAHEAHKATTLFAEAANMWDALHCGNMAEDCRKLASKSARLVSRMAELRASGLRVGLRDPQRNQAFSGRFMVAEPCDESVLPTSDAQHGGFCIVGDDLAELIDTAHANFCE
jgi:hypothetical protein